MIEGCPCCLKVNSAFEMQIDIIKFTIYSASIFSGFLSGHKYTFLEAVWRKLNSFFFVVNLFFFCLFFFLYTRWKRKKHIKSNNTVVSVDADSFELEVSTRNAF